MTMLPTERRLREMGIAGDKSSFGFGKRSWRIRCGERRRDPECSSTASQRPYEVWTPTPC